MSEEKDKINIKCLLSSSPKLTRQVARKVLQPKKPSLWKRLLSLFFFDFDSLLGVQALREVRTRILRGEHSRSHCVIQYRKEKSKEPRVGPRDQAHAPTEVSSGP